MKTILKIGVLSIIGLCFIVFSGCASAFSNQAMVAGYNGSTSVGEDPHGQGDWPKEAIHPQNDAYENYVVIAYSMETNQPNPYVMGEYVRNVRIVLSSNHGSSWAIFEWAYLNVNVNQDYPDVQFVEDTTDGQIHVVVVWQEQDIYETNAWTVKARERMTVGSGGNWGNLQQVSTPDDSENNIYPKVSTTSNNGVTHWNVVWQRYYSSNSAYGVLLNIYTMDQYWGGFSNPQNIAIPLSSNEEYKHPATDCIHSTSGWETVYIIYDATLPLYQDPNGPPVWPERIRVEFGTLSNMRGPYAQSASIDLDSASQDGTIGYPDIAVVGQTGGTGNTVDCVWYKGTNVEYSRSMDGGSTFSTPTTISTSGGNGYLRGIAIDMGTFFGSPNVHQVSIVWTNGNNIYYIKRTSSGGVWNTNFGNQQQVTNDSPVDDFVDVSVYNDLYPGITIYAHISWEKYDMAVMYTREP